MFDRFSDRVRSMRLIDASPEAIAVSFGVGVFIGFTPLVGLHTVIALVAAQVFRLRSVPAVTGVFVSNPVSFVPIYTFCLWVGALVMGVDVTDVLISIKWKQMSFMTMAEELGALLVPFFVGTTAMGLLGGFVGYVALREYLARDRSREEQRSLEEGAEKAE